MIDDQRPQTEIEVWETISWSVGDVQALLLSMGYTPSEENAQRVIDECGHHFRDRCIQMGWAVLESFIDITDDLEEQANDANQGRQP